MPDDTCDAPELGHTPGWDRAGVEPKGFHAHRLEYQDGSRSTERERAFAQRWREENTRGPGMTNVLPALCRRYVSASADCRVERVETLHDLTFEDERLVATVVQWLGTNVGFCFLEEALERAGYKVVDKRAATPKQRQANERAELLDDLIEELRRRRASLWASGETPSIER